MNATTTKEEHMPTCPHCGNTNPATIADNGCRGRDLTLLCLNRVSYDQTSFDGCAPDQLPGYDEATQTAECGMQWDPNDN